MQIFICQECGVETETKPCPQCFSTDLFEKASDEDMKGVFEAAA